MRRKKRRPSSSRDRRIKKRKRDIAISKKSSSSSSRKRAQKRKKELKKIYRRRRIALSLFVFVLVFGISKFTFNKLTAYSSYTYPTFRDEVRKSIGKEVFVGSTTERSLTTAEKLADLDILYENISRNYGVNASNREDFNNFIKGYEAIKKKVLASKTDQEYFNIIMAYLDLLNNPKTKLMDKKNYDDLLKYYKNNNETEKSQIIQNPQAIDRYKRMISEKGPEVKTNFSVNDNILIVSMNDFNLGDIKEDIDEYNKVLNENEKISKILIDLSNNSSFDNIYWQEFLPLLAHKDYSDKSLVFYRGNLIKSTLEDIKNKSKNYETTFVQNQASKYPDKISEIDLDDYMYYDEVSLNIINNSEYKNLSVFVLTNDATSNEGIKFANALKQSADAKIIKNTSTSEKTANDLISNFPVDYFILEHSGLIVSIDDSFNLSNEEAYPTYDQHINTVNPIETVLSTL
ncbi:MAG: hypothetical protein ACTIH2_07275 [Anaerococcus sp.]